MLKGAGALLARLERARHSQDIDVVVGTSMSGEPDLVAPMTPLTVAGLVRAPYRTFPLADHLADKLCAIIGTYRAGQSVRSSSRIKDLVDIALIASTQHVSGPALRSAIIANTAHRGLTIPDTFAVPEEASWRRGYATVAADVPGKAPTFDEAVALASALLNPALSAPIDGEWDPVVSKWV